MQLTLKASLVFGAGFLVAMFLTKTFISDEPFQKFLMDCIGIGFCLFAIGTTIGNLISWFGPRRKIGVSGDNEAA